jgi:hypothetical protein
MIEIGRMKFRLLSVNQDVRQTSIVLTHEPMQSNGILDLSQTPVPYNAISIDETGREIESHATHFRARPGMITLSISRRTRDAPNPTHVRLMIARKVREVAIPFKTGPLKFNLGKSDDPKTNQEPIVEIVPEP